MATVDTFNSKRELPVGGHYFSISGLDENGIDTSHLPYSIRILLENIIRNFDDFSITKEHVERILNWKSNQGPIVGRLQCTRWVCFKALDAHTKDESRRVDGICSCFEWK